MFKLYTIIVSLAFLVSQTRSIYVALDDTLNFQSSDETVVEFKSNGRPLPGVYTQRIITQPETCSIRVDFKTFELNDPVQLNNVTAYACASDLDVFELITLDMPETNLPLLCGGLSGQHIYVQTKDYNETTSLDTEVLGTLTLRFIILGNVLSAAPAWDIVLTQISCPTADDVNSELIQQTLLPPAGCLQYYTNASGTIESFNLLRGSYLGNMAYKICFEPSSDKCGIKLTGLKFELSTNGDTSTGSDCDTAVELDAFVSKDYLLIPNARVSFAGGNVTISADKYCGQSLSKQNIIFESQDQVPSITFVADGVALPLNPEVGFRFDYELLTDC